MEGHTKLNRSLSLLRRLYGAFVVVALVGVCATGALVDRNVQSANLSHFEDHLTSEAKMLGQITESALASPLDEEDAVSFNEVVRTLGASASSRLTIVSARGHVLADSGAAPTGPPSLANEALAPEIADAARMGRGKRVRDVDGTSRLLVAVPILREGRVLGYARASVPLADVLAEGREVRVRTAYGAIAATLLALVLGFALSTTLVRPLRALTEGARRVGAGDWNTEIPVTTNDELGELATAFNAMTRNVQRVVSELSASNAATRLVLDNVDQGLVTADLAGRLGDERSAALVTWFGPLPAGVVIWDYLFAKTSAERAYFRLSWEALGADVLPLELAIDQIPKGFMRGGRSYGLSCLPIRQGERLDRMLVMISDVTADVERERVEGEQREMLAAFSAMLQDPSGFHDFFEEAAATAMAVRTGRDSAGVRRSIHTLKGNAAAFGLSRVADTCDAVEDLLNDRSNSAPTPAERETIWSAWAAVAARLEPLLAQKRTGYFEVTDAELRALSTAVARGQPRTVVDAMIASWRHDLASTRLERLAAQVPGLARRLGKGEVEVVVDGGSVRVPRDAWRSLWAALVHVIRNAIDHGLETPGERMLVGKKPVGRIDLRAKRGANSVVIEIVDDGRGIDWPAIARAATARGLAAVTHENLVAALFHEGTTTRRETSSVSGRGVGLSAALYACVRLRGRVEVDATAGRGACFRFIVPMPLGGDVA
jgi:HAMP domain-containing protein/HPt (histidine-containing phosphotransfer) domain-containing protein